MKVKSLFALSLASIISLTSCGPTREPAAQDFAAPAKKANNVIYLHHLVTKREDAGSTFNSYLRSGNVVIDFYADWCGPCKLTARSIDQVAPKYSSITFLKVNVDQFPDLSTGIRSIPTMLFYKNGTQVAKITGGKSRAAFQELLMKYY